MRPSGSGWRRAVLQKLRRGAELGHPSEAGPEMEPLDCGGLEPGPRLGPPLQEPAALRCAMVYRSWNWLLRRPDRADCAPGVRSQRRRWGSDRISQVPDFRFRDGHANELTNRR